VGINFIRFLLATLVLISHSWPLTGYGKDPTFIYKDIELTLGTFAVSLFFGISGFLVGYSVIKRSATDFILNRILRILPAYVLILFVSAFLLGPLIHFSEGGGGLNTYFNFNQDGPIAYFLHNLLMPMDVTYKINNLFETNPYSFAINGSLWTLPLEFRLYLLLLLLVLIGKSIRGNFVTILFISYLIFYFVFEELEIEIMKVIYSNFITQNINLISIFFLSAGIAVYGHKIRFKAFPLLLVLVLIFWLDFYTEVFGIVILMILLPKISKLTKINNFNFFKNDLSYGLYVFSFPTQQAVAYFFPEFNLLEFILVALTFSVTLSLFSWKFVESPFLRIKKKVQVNA
jgi:peptidoglycan/LPS O-acetylase OafA/YrhL